MDAFVNAVFTQPTLGVFVNVWKGPLLMLIFGGSWGWAAECLPSVRGRQRFRYHQAENWIATRCPLTVDLGMATG